MAQPIDFRRFGVISYGYCVAAATAGLAISGVIAVAGSVGANFQEFGWIILMAMLTAGLTIPYTFLFALLPAAVLIFLAERQGARSPTVYAVMGALAGLAVPLCVWAFLVLTGSIPGPATRAPTLGTLQEFGRALAFYALPGLLGGLAYWAAAGRTAGSAGRSHAQPVAKDEASAA
jgi:hypothetical protein